MSSITPIIRIVLRYGVGFLLGAEVGEQLAMDQDVVTGIALAVGAVTEGAYGLAKKKGWKT